MKSGEAETAPALSCLKKKPKKPLIVRRITPICESEPAKEFLMLASNGWQHACPLGMIVNKQVSDQS
jgi:hypothetical protein